MKTILSFVEILSTFVFIDVWLRYNTKWDGVYFLLHFLHNMVVSWCTFRNVLYTFFLTVDGEELDDNLLLPLIYGFHVYHMVCYFSIFRPDDWMHHIFSMIFAVPLTMYFFTEKYLLGMCFFFTTGFPGGINYLLLFLSKNGMCLSKEKQLSYNSVIQSWIRCPGIIMTSGFVLQKVFLQHANYYKQLAGCLIFCILYWNGIYFQNIVMEANVKKKIILKKKNKI